MKTVRFSKVVASAGKPEAHLLLVEAAKDRELQTAIKAHRVMTVRQPAAGTKADQGTIGFDPGKERQYLIFPRSLKAFAGKAVVGVKYDLLDTPKIAKNQRAKLKKPTAKSKAKPSSKQSPLRESKAPPPKNVVAFRKPEPEAKEAVDEEDVVELKQQVRKAMDALEAGKQVAAFNLLKKIVEP